MTQSESIPRTEFQLAPSSSAGIRRSGLKARSQTRQLPKVSRPLLSWFTWYSRRYVRRHFHSLRVSLKGLPPETRELPLVIYSNHASWWDALVCLVLKEQFFPGPHRVRANGCRDAGTIQILRPARLLRRGTAKPSRGYPIPPHRRGHSAVAAKPPRHHAARPLRWTCANARFASSPGSVIWQRGFNARCSCLSPPNMSFGRNGCRKFWSASVSRWKSNLNSGRRLPRRTGRTLFEQKLADTQGCPCCSRHNAATRRISNRVTRRRGPRRRL